MQDYKLLPFLILLLLAAIGEIEPRDILIDEYADFKIEPEYITNPSPDREPYFAAYDKTLELWGVDYEELYINTSKGVAHVVVSGPKNAVPIILLNGMSSSSTMWYPNAKKLSEEYRLFGIDLIIEPGKSYKTVDLKNINEINSWYQEVFTALKLDSYHLMGTSRGGWLATNLALHSEENTKSLILLGPVQTFINVPLSTGLVKNIFNIFYSKEKQAIRTMETLSNDPSKIDKHYIEQYRLALENDSLNKFVSQMRPFSNKKLQSLHMPVLVLIGEKDLFNTKRSIHLAEKHISKAQGEIISDSGHFITVDQTEIVNQRILDFLKSVDKKD